MTLAAATTGAAIGGILLILGIVLLGALAVLLPLFIFLIWLKMGAIATEARWAAAHTRKTAEAVTYLAGVQQRKMKPPADGAMRGTAPTGP